MGVAAQHATEAGIRWAACPDDWGLGTPIECGFVTVPVDYAKPDGATTKLVVPGAPGPQPAPRAETGRQADHLIAVRYRRLRQG
ncbi:hypothetical protein ACWC9T_40780 [Kitasatospora sp. NPDC001159]